MGWVFARALIPAGTKTSEQPTNLKIPSPRLLKVPEMGSRLVADRRVPWRADLERLLLGSIAKGIGKGTRQSTRRQNGCNPHHTRTSDTINRNQEMYPEDCDSTKARIRGRMGRERDLRKAVRQQLEKYEDARVRQVIQR